MSERFIIKSDGIIDTYNSRNVLSLSELCETLNEYEEQRVKKKKLISQYMRREEKFQNIVTGLMSYLELKINEEIWSDWND